MKRALIIGIDDYPNAPLKGCVNDAISIAHLLEKHGDGAPNFDVKCLVSNEVTVDTNTLHSSITELFTTGEADTVLFYFAGHGGIDSNTSNGFIVSQNGQHPTWGISLSEILTLANSAHPKIKSTVIILDCCQSGAIGEVPALGNTSNISVIGEGVTLLTACHREQFAAETPDNQGLFTSMVIDALEGSSADICGNITPAAIYSHVDQTLGSWSQRPIYKANVQNFVVLRKIPPKVSLEVLRELPRYFESPTSIFRLDPSFEPDRENVPERYRDIPVNHDHTAIFKKLQICNRHGLVVPVDTEHMYDAAMQSTGCQLTALGAHYRKLAEIGRL